MMAVTFEEKTIILLFDLPGCFYEHLLKSIDLGLGFPDGSVGKESAYQCRRHRRHRLDLRVGKIPWRKGGNPLQSSCLENSMDGGAWWAIVQRVAKSWTQLLVWTKYTHTQVLAYNNIN